MGEMGEKMDDVLNDDVVEQSTEAQVQDEGVSVQADAVDEKSQDQRMVPLPALHEERKKRQELAQKLQEMEHKLNSMQVEKVPPKDDWNDDEIYDNVPAAIRKLESKFEKTLGERLRQERYTTSEAMAKDMYDDYDDVISIYMDLAKENPSILGEMERSHAPAIKAYKIAKKHLEDKKKKSLSEDDLEKLVQERVAKELEKLASSKTMEDLPRSLNGVRGSNGKSVVGYETIDEIFGR